MSNDNLLFYDALNSLCDKYGIVGFFGVAIQNTGKWSNISISRPIGKDALPSIINALSQSPAYFSGMVDSFRLLNKMSFTGTPAAVQPTKVLDTEMPH